MIFDYNPITGLVYTPLDESFFLIDISILPSGKSTSEILEEWRQCIKELGIQILDTTYKPTTEIFSPIISNVFYEVFK